MSTEKLKRCILDIDCGPYEHYRAPFDDVDDAMRFKLAIESTMNKSSACGGFIGVPSNTDKTVFVNVAKIISLTIEV